MIDSDEWPGYFFDVPRTPSFDELYLFNTTTGHWKLLNPQQLPREWPKPRYLPLRPPLLHLFLFLLQCLKVNALVYMDAGG